MSEEYRGVKFKTVMLGNEIPSDPRLAELQQWCGIFHQHDLAPAYSGGSYGNLSFRIAVGKKEFIITGTCIGLKECPGNEKFVTVENCDLDKGFIYARGMREPSSESMMHYAIYRARKDVMAIFHGHSPAILSSSAKLALPVTDAEEPYGTRILAEKLAALAAHHDFFIARNHGFISIAASMDEAGKLAMDMLQKAKKTR